MRLCRWNEHVGRLETVVTRNGKIIDRKNSLEIAVKNQDDSFYFLLVKVMTLDKIMHVFYLLTRPTTF